MRIADTIAKLGWNLPRFARQLAWVIAGLLGMIVLSAVAFWLFVYYAGTFEGGPTERQLFAREALATDAPRIDCVGPGRRIDNPYCLLPAHLDSRYCHWWRLEMCGAYGFNDIILDHPDKLGTVVSLMTDPCIFVDKVHSESLRRDCQDPEIFDENPIVLVFKGDHRTVKMRIDVKPR